MTSPDGRTSPAELPLKILILDDEPPVIEVMEQLLTSKHWQPIGCLTSNELWSHFETMVPQVVIIDVYLGNGEDGLNVVRQVRQRYPDVGIAVISGEDTETLANKANDSGADYFLSKPIIPAAIILTVQKMAELCRQRSRNLELERALKEQTSNSAFPEILTHSDSMKAVLKLVEKVAGRDLSVLIYGESGTGKELVARAIHQTSSRARGNFVELNCAALPPNLVESELFGHEKGAFTGAVAARPGKIELASGGTLLLDEIGELPLDIQPKLLRALQERRIVRVGGKRDIECDFRLVTATHRDLLEEVRHGRFREDLFYRVAVFPIKLPPLRDRMEDLDMLLTNFLRQEGIEHPNLTRVARQILHAYDWPGNVRELKNFAQAAPLLSEEGLIDEATVRQYFGARFGGASHPAPRSSGIPPGEVEDDGSGALRPVHPLEELERSEILHALAYYQGDVTAAAKALGMGRSTLYKFLKKHAIQPESFVPRL